MAGPARKRGARSGGSRGGAAEGRPKRSRWAEELSSDSEGAGSTPPRAAPPRRSAAPGAAPALIDVPDGVLETGGRSLAELKAIARRAGLHSSWQAVGARHRRELAAALARQRRDELEFVRSVRARSFEESLARALCSLEQDAHLLAPRGKPAERDAALRALRGVLEAALGAAVHVVPSGSGVHLGDGYVLTCAHVVATDDDADDEEGSGLAAGATRVGRRRELVTARGDHLPASCVAADEAADLALLRVPGGAPGLGAIPLAREGGDAPGAAVVAVGNPYDWDLERPEGARPRRNGFTPFWASGGRIQGQVDAGVAVERGVGPQRHSCWTYWGHSGCPLVNEAGEVAALHSSWDAGNKGQRHGVPLDRMAAFVARHAPGLAPGSGA